MKVLPRVIILSLLVTLVQGCQPQDGEDGNNGITSLTIMDPEQPGTNCEFGGIKVVVGSDQNGNLLLEPNEITDTKYVCNGLNDPITKEIRIVIFNENTGGIGTSGSRALFFPGIIRFNKNNWPHATSITYNAFLRTDKGETDAVLELYDKTNDQIITQSQLKTNATTLTPLYSQNLIQYLPNSTIDLYLKLSSSWMNSDDGAVISKKSELIIKQEL